MIGQDQSAAHGIAPLLLGLGTTFGVTKENTNDLDESMWDGGGGWV
jgi:hypothetical protein